ncbi:MAG: hypothetical protein ACKOCP_01980 [Candidatus Nanopelagicus sp.]
MAIIKFITGKSRGSLIPLSFGFFLMAMTLTFISVNIASAFSVKKELTNIAEAAINKSAQSINSLAYYAQVNRFNKDKRVPIDCLAAQVKFYALINQVRLYEKQIKVDQFICELYEVSAHVSISGEMPIQIPFVDSILTNRLVISTQVGASSVYIPN